MSSTDCMNWDAPRTNPRVVIWSACGRDEGQVATRASASNPSSRPASSFHTITRGASGAIAQKDTSTGEIILLSTY